MTNKTIQIDADGAGFVREEAVGSGALLPGTIVEKITGNVIQAHSVEGGRGLTQVVVEDALQGKTLLNAYTSGARVQYNIQRPGTRFGGILKAGENVVTGDELVSDGAGCLIKSTSVSSGTTVAKVLAYAEEALDLTGSGAVDTLIVARAA